MSRGASTEKEKDATEKEVEMDQFPQRMDSIEEIEQNVEEKELSPTDLCYDEYLEGKFNGAFEHDTNILTKL